MSENSSNLNRNLEILNIKFEKFIKFIYNSEKSIIKISENKSYILNDNPKLKELLKQKLDIQFEGTNKYWYIPQKQVEILSSNVIKSFSNEDLENMKKKIYEYVGSIKEEDLRKPIKEIFDSVPDFFKKPAASKLHHNYQGGLAQHTIEVYDLALSMANVILNSKEIDINLDLLKAGALLHDIGKNFCYEIDDIGYIKNTKIKIYHDHIVYGIKIVSQYVESKYLDDLIHIIASHHQLEEWGSPIEPKTNEAWIIHLSDNLSSKIFRKYIIF